MWIFLHADLRLWLSSKVLIFHMCLFPHVYYYYYYCLFRASHMVYGGSQFRGPIRTVADGLCHSHSNARSKLCLQPTLQLTAMPDPLTHWARSGIEPVSSWLLDRFITTEPQRELSNFIYCITNEKKMPSSFCSKKVVKIFY